MKFKYVGELPIKDMDLVLAKIFTPHQRIIKGTVFEVPDKDVVLIQRVKLNGYYEEVPEKKAVSAKKKQKGKKGGKIDGYSST